LRQRYVAYRRALEPLWNLCTLFEPSGSARIKKMLSQNKYLDGGRTRCRTFSMNPSLRKKVRAFGAFEAKRLFSAPPSPISDRENAPLTDMQDQPTATTTARSSRTSPAAGSSMAQPSSGWPISPRGGAGIPTTTRRQRAYVHRSRAEGERLPRYDQPRICR